MPVIFGFVVINGKKFRTSLPSSTSISMCKNEHCLSSYNSAINVNYPSYSVYGLASFACYCQYEYVKFAYNVFRKVQSI